MSNSKPAVPGAAEDHGGRVFRYQPAYALQRPKMRLLDRPAAELSTAWKGTAADRSEAKSGTVHSIPIFARRRPSAGAPQTPSALAALRTSAAATSIRQP